MSSDSDEAVDRAVWTAPESSVAAGRRFFGRFRSWTNVTLDDVSGGSDRTPEVDLSDIVSAHSALDSLAEARRNFAATLLSEQQQFVASRDFLADRRREITEARDELSLARAELVRRGAELQERKRGLAQREAAIDASGTAEQLQK